MAKKRTAPVLTVILAESSDGGYIAYVRELPGCMTQGDTINEVKENVQDLVPAWLEAMIEQSGTKQELTPQGKIVLETKYRVRRPELIPA
ncbi:MAG: type II toxin-antitoxin system HicB family antitoxin [bacterium]